VPKPESQHQPAPVDVRERLALAVAAPRLGVVGRRREHRAKGAVVDEGPGLEVDEEVAAEGHLLGGEGWRGGEIAGLRARLRGRPPQRTCSEAAARRRRPAAAAAAAAAADAPRGLTPNGRAASAAAAAAPPTAGGSGTGRGGAVAAAASAGCRIRASASPEWKEPKPPGVSGGGRRGGGDGGPRGSADGPRGGRGGGAAAAVAAPAVSAARASAMLQFDCYRVRERSAPVLQSRPPARRPRTRTRATPASPEVRARGSASYAP
jgi:hypothetical protein